MGQEIVLPDGAFTSGNVIYPDSLMSAGSLVLHDLGHSLGGVSGLPANSAPIPNVAYAPAAALIGSGTSATLASVYKTTGVTADQPFFERTPKLGLHIIESQVHGATQSNNTTINLASPIAGYMVANPTHLYYLSTWYATTRVAANLAAPDDFLGVNTSQFLEIQQTNAYVGSPAFVHNAPATRGAVGPTYAARQPSFTGTPSLSFAVPFGWGFPGAYGGTYINDFPSKIFYRFYLEDLTVSGRTAAAVDALDYALYNAAFSAGGKFYGDTYTAPSAYP